MRVRDVMTEKIVSIAPDASVAEALDVMTNSHLSGLPVIDAAGNLVEIVSEADFLRRFELGTGKSYSGWLTQLMLPGRAAEVYARAHAKTVEEVMSANVVTIEEDATLGEAVALMEGKRVKRLPVVAGNKLIGMVTRADFVRALARFVRRAPDGAAISDDEIRQRIRAEMRAQAWAPVATVDVTVENGVVKLHGVLTDERERKALRALAEGVSGVKSVEDHMVWAEAFSGLVMPSPEDLPKGNAA